MKVMNKNEGELSVLQPQQLRVSQQSFDLTLLEIFFNLFSKFQENGEQGSLQVKHLMQLDL